MRIFAISWTAWYGYTKVDGLARRIRDPVFAEDEVRDERRRTARTLVELPAQLRAGDLTLSGVVRDVSSGGAFLSTNLLIEIGEHGTLIVDDLEIAVQVVWLRGNAHASGPGMGLLFDETGDRLARVLEKLGG